MATLRVVVDTNVFISALVFGGKPREVLMLFVISKLQLVITEELLTELRRTLRSKFPKFKREGMQLEQLLRRDAVMVSLGNHVLNVARDQRDNHVLEAALLGQVDLIISGDKDLLTLSEFQGVSIRTPVELLSNLSGS